MLSAKLAATPAPGTVIGGKYRVERPLGSGGMGVVVAATHLGLNQPVAIKVLLPRAAKDDDSITRFVREGRAAARLTSPFAAKVYDSGRLPSGAPYLVLELLRGRDLRSHLAEVGRVPLAQAVDWILQAAHALAEAHTHRIIHRDVKPANLFLAETSSGHHIKVLDFGVSKELGGIESDLTNTASVLGTPRYMAPEQMRSAKLVDARCDVWSLGVVLYELTTGETPFRGDSATALCFDVMERTPVPPSRLNPELPPAFDALIVRCLAKDPDERIRSMEALTEALRPFASDGRASLPFIVPPATPSQPGTSRASTPDAFAPAPSSRRGAATPLGAAQPTPAERHSVETIRSWDTSSAHGSSVNRRRLPLVALGFGVGLTITAIVSVAVPMPDSVHVVTPSASSAARSSPTARFQ